MFTNIFIHFKESAVILRFSEKTIFFASPSFHCFLLKKHVFMSFEDAISPQFSPEKFSIILILNIYSKFKEKVFAVTTITIFFYFLIFRIMQINDLYFEIYKGEKSNDKVVLKN